MSKIFISHSSADGASALALAQWLDASGWADYFLDLSPTSRGLAAGEQWQAALKSAADRCEAVICLISPAWVASKWCLAEFLYAKQLGKRMFGVLIASTPAEELPRELTAEWQLCDLAVGGVRDEFRVVQEPLVPETVVSFATDGLARLRTGLQRAGLDPESFPWPPKNDPARLPYRGLLALEPEDAAVFFGREASVVRALDALRKRREPGTERLFVILGASGSGKSSFLRAGLWPRLARDDRNFLPLPVMRPERAPMTGAGGLAACIDSAFQTRKVPKARASIAQTLQQEHGLSALLTELQQLAVVPADITNDSGLPTVVVSIDQGEELLAGDARQEAELLLKAIAFALTSPPCAETGGLLVRPPLVIVAIRSDCYELLQTQKWLAGLATCLFDLRPLSRSEYKAVIEGPAMRATDAGKPLKIDAQLTERLIEDAEGADALPLLGFTLERLFLQYGSLGRLRLADYEALGGVRGSVEAAVQAAFDEPERVPAIPADANVRQRLLHAAFVPWLARVDPHTEQRKRRVALWEELPSEAMPLLERLIGKRLLVKGRATSDDQDTSVTLEVAHEALLRQWPALTEWLAEDSLALKRLELVEKAVTEWAKNRDHDSGDEAWLVHTGERLALAEALRSRPDFERQLGEDGRDYLDACRARDERVRTEREQRLKQIQAERDRAELERQRAEKAAVEATQAAHAAEQSERRAVLRTRLAVASLLVVLVTLPLLAYFIISVRVETEKGQVKEEQARASQRTARSISLASQSDYLLGKAPDLSLLLALGALSQEPNVEARSALLNSLRDNRMLKSLLHGFGQLNDVAVSRDGMLIATAGEDGKVVFWDASGAKREGASLEHSGAVTAVAFDAAGNRVATASESGEVLLWDVQTRKRLIQSERRHKGRANGLAFSPDGTIVASAGEDRSVQLWDTATGRLSAPVLAGHNDSVTSVAFSPDGQTLATGSMDGQVVLWNLLTRQASALRLHNHPVTGVAFDASGQMVASGSRDGSVALWDVGRRRLLHQLVSINRKQPVTAVAFSPEGATLAASADDGTIELWEVSWGGEGTSLGTLTGLRSPVTGLAFGPVRNRLVSSTHSGIAAIWDLESDKRIAVSFAQQRAAVDVITFGGPKDQILATLGRDGSILLRDAATGVIRLPILKGEGEFTAMALSRDGRVLASGSRRGQLSLWNAESGARLGEPWHAHNGELTAVALSRDGATLASASEDRSVVIWDVATHQPRGASLSHKDWVRAVAISPDGKTLVSGGNDGLVVVWDLASAKAIAVLSGHTAAVTSVAFSPDGKKFASGSFDQNAIVWSLETMKAIGAPLAGHTDAITGLAFGEWLVTAGSEGTVILWDLATRKQIGRPLGIDDRAILSIALTSDSQRLATGHANGKTTFWSINLERWKELACQVANRNLSCREWHQFLETAPHEKLCQTLPDPPDAADCAARSQPAAAGR